MLSAPSVAPVPAQDRYAVGLVLAGKYRLDSLLGEGGMGSVWRATNLPLELPVAIKLIRADLDRGSLRARLQVEARSAAKLGHPAIVRVFDVGQSEAGDPFIVMELLHGETMATTIANGRISGTRTVQLLLPIIDALGMAHARGIVHRDLKPDNVMIALEDQHIQPKILDFGIAKLTDPRDSDHKLTEIGSVVGSPDYMSPEQARGRDDLDAATDIWSICVVLYEAVTGNAPFSASNYNALLRAIVEDQPKSIVEQGAGDEALWQIIQRGMAKDRAARFGSMSELGRALASWLVSLGIQEDACGTALESKWLVRPSDPRALAQGSGSVAATSTELPQGTAQEARDGGTGVARGPFTATIRPHGRGRKRAFGVVLVGCALFALAAIALNRRHAASPAIAPLAATPTHSVALVVPVPAAQPVTVQHEAEVVPAITATPPALVSAATAVATTPRPATPHLVKAAANAGAARPPALETAAKPAASSAPTLPAKPSERPLDLLAPY